MKVRRDAGRTEKVGRKCQKDGGCGRKDGTDGSRKDVTDGSYGRKQRSASSMEGRYEERQKITRAGKKVRGRQNISERQKKKGRTKRKETKE